MTYYEINNIDPHKVEVKYIYNHTTKKWVRKRANIK